MIDGLTSEDIVELNTTAGGLARPQWLDTLDEIRLGTVPRVVATCPHEEDSMMDDLKDLKGRTAVVVVATLGLVAALVKFPPRTLLGFVLAAKNKLK